MREFSITFKLQCTQTSRGDTIHINRIQYLYYNSQFEYENSSMQADVTVCRLKKLKQKSIDISKRYLVGSLHQNSANQECFNNTGHQVSIVDIKIVSKEDKTPTTDLQSSHHPLKKTQPQQFPRPQDSPNLLQLCHMHG